MPEFNPTTNSRQSASRTQNKAGGVAYEPLSPQQRLCMVTLANLLEKTYYEDDDESVAKVQRAFEDVAREDPKFPLQLAAFARNEMYLRDVSQLLVVTAAHDDRCVRPDDETTAWVRTYGAKALERPDDAATLIAMNDALYGKPLPSPLKKAIGDYLNTVDAYQLGKYRLERREVSLVDVFNRTHPKPQDSEQEELFTRFMRGHLDDYPDIDPLPTPETWETIVSNAPSRSMETTASFTQARKANTTMVGYASELMDHRESPDKLPGSLRGTKYSLSIPASDNEATVSVNETDVGIAISASVDESAQSITGDRYTLSVKAYSNDGTPRRHRPDDTGQILIRPSAEYPEQVSLRITISNVKAAWEDAVSEMPIFARLRNIRNALQAGIPPKDLLTEEDLDRLGNTTIYPFRIYQAYQAVEQEGVMRPHVREWLEKALTITTGNLPDSLTNTYVAVDLSGSMSHEISGNSNTSCKDIASLFGVLFGANGGDVGVFGTDFRPLRVNDAPVLAQMRGIEAVDSEVGNKTNGWKAIDYLTQNAAEYDRIVLLTDCQIYDSTAGIFSSKRRSVKEAFMEYRQKVRQDTELYMVDLSQYGDLLLPEDTPGVYHINGWTSRIIQFMDSTNDFESFVEEVRAYE